MEIIIDLPFGFPINNIISLGSALVKIMPINGCCCFRFVVRLPHLHAKHLPPRPSSILWRSLPNSLTTPHCAHVCTSLGVSALATILHSQTLARAAHSTKNLVRVGQVYPCRICQWAASPKDPARLGFCWPFRSRHHLIEWLKVWFIDLHLYLYFWIVNYFSFLDMSGLVLHHFCWKECFSRTPVS